MVYRILYSENELYHEGVRGMRWGIRKYQNLDGTWTALGKRRRRLSPDAQKRADRKNKIKNLQSKGELERAKASYKVEKALNKKAVQEARGEKLSLKERLTSARKKTGLETTKEAVIRSGSGDKVQKHAQSMTNEELQDAIKRIELQNQLDRVSAQQKQKGIDAYKRVADVANTTANLTKNGIEVYNNVAKVMNAFNVGGKSDRKIIGEKSDSGPDALTRREREARVRTAEAMAERNELQTRQLRDTVSGSSSSSNSNSSSSSSGSSSSSSSNSGNSNSSSSSSSNTSGANSVSSAINTMRSNAQALARAERAARIQYGPNSSEYAEVRATREAAERIRDLRIMQYETRSSTTLSDTAIANADREVQRLLDQERSNGAFQRLSNVDNILDRYRDWD